ncbi:unnamed protein product, partial [Candidula unifasciata]
CRCLADGPGEKTRSTLAWSLSAITQLWINKTGEKKPSLVMSKVIWRGHPLVFPEQECWQAELQQQDPSSRHSHLAAGSRLTTPQSHSATSKMLPWKPCQNITTFRFTLRCCTERKDLTISCYICCIILTVIFNKMNMDNKRNLMYIEPCKGEKVEYANVCDRLKHAQKMLGGAYSLLLLGLELEEQHHMACGRSKLSRTNTDRSLFETFYQFCTYFVWITFYRKQFVQIQQEVGRLLRSDTFNPALRAQAETAGTGGTELTKAEDKEEVWKEQTMSEQEQKSTQRESRRHYPKRPAIKSIVNQRSPAIISILPSPKEEAHRLFRRPHEKTERSSFYALRDAEADDYTENNLLDQMLDVSSFKVGLLGQLYRQFNPLTLSPVGPEAGGEANTDDHEENSAILFWVAKGQEAAICEVCALHAALSRQATAISRATTEAVFTDDEC